MDLLFGNNFQGPEAGLVLSTQLALLVSITANSTVDVLSIRNAT